MKKLLMMSAAIVVGLSATASANEALQALIDDPAQWPIQTGDYENTRYSELDQITKDNVGDLQVAWTFSTGVLRGHEGSPLVIGDIMYVHTPFPNIVYALNLAEDGKIMWKYEPKQDPNVIPVMCCDTVYRGVAYADDTIFLHQADTTLVALDAKTGEVKWSVVNGDPSIGETNTATVLPIKDKVIVGISGGEFGVRGSTTAPERICAPTSAPFSRIQIVSSRSCSCASCARRIPMVSPDGPAPTMTTSKFIASLSTINLG